MTQLPLNVRLLHADAIVPTRSTKGSAGLDLYSVETVVLMPNTPVKIRTGIAMQLPPGHVGLILDRSGLGSKGVRTLAGVLDQDYEGEVMVCLALIGHTSITLNAGDRIAQLVVLPIPDLLVQETWDASRQSDRGAGGFGSSGA
jgi:dUTP pyrophosphatase